MHLVYSRHYRALLLVLLTLTISACGTPQTAEQPVVTPSSSTTSVPSTTSSPVASATPVTNTTPTVPSALPNANDSFVEGQKITTIPSKAFDLWTDVEGGERVTERPKLYGSSAATILKIMPSAVQLRTPEGVEGWVRQPITEVATSNDTVQGEVAKFGLGVRVQIALANGIPLRQNPSSSAAKLREQIAGGQQATMQELRGDWLRLTLDDGLEGWARWYYDGEQYIVPPTIQGSIRWRTQAPYSTPATLYVRLKKVHGSDEPQTIAEQTVTDVRFEAGLGAGVPFALFANEPVDQAAAYGVSAHVDVDRDGQMSAADYRVEEPYTNPAEPYLVPATLIAEPMTQAPTPSFPATITVSGSVKVGVERPIPPNAELVIQLQRWADSRLGGPGILDEHVVPLTSAGTFPFTLETSSADVPESLANLMTYELYAEVRSPGRLPWTTSYPFAIQQPPADAELVLEAPENITLVTGSVLVPPTPALPENAALTIRVVSETGLDGINIGKLVIPSVKAGSIPFTIEYPSLAIDQEQTYAIHAEVRVDGTLPLVSPLYPIFTKDNPTEVNAVVAPPTKIINITGTATYPATPALPSNAVFTVKLLDITSADGPEVILAQDTIVTVGLSPIAFAIEYDPALIDQRHTYVLSANIESNDKLIFASETLNSVLTHGAPTDVAMNLKAYP